MSLMYFFPTLIFPLGWIQERCGAYRQFQPQKSITCSSENSFSPVLRTDNDLNLNIWEETNSLFLPYPHHILWQVGLRWAYGWLSLTKSTTARLHSNRIPPALEASTQHGKTSALTALNETRRRLDWLTELYLLSSDDSSSRHVNISTKECCLDRKDSGRLLRCV